jgi:hypothetical protein
MLRRAALKSTPKLGMSPPMDNNPLQDVAHVIQLAVAPVFLLSSLGTFLGVMSARLGRIVDRMRILDDRAPTASPDRVVRMRAELGTLVARRRLINGAITFGTAAALMVCGLISVAFLGTILQLSWGVGIAGMFVASMACIVVALLLFLREVLLASSSSPVVTDFHGP